MKYVLFIPVEFDLFKSEAGLPTFVLSAKQWIEKTNAILTIKSKTGNYETYKIIINN